MGVMERSVGGFMQEFNRIVGTKVGGGGMMLPARMPGGWGGPRKGAQYEGIRGAMMGGYRAGGIMESGRRLGRWMGIGFDPAAESITQMMRQGRYYGQVAGGTGQLERMVRSPLRVPGGVGPRVSGYAAGVKPFQEFHRKMGSAFFYRKMAVGGLAAGGLMLASGTVGIGNIMTMGMGAAAGAGAGALAGAVFPGRAGGAARAGRFARWGGKVGAVGMGLGLLTGVM